MKKQRELLIQKETGRFCLGLAGPKTSLHANKGNLLHFIDCQIDKLTKMTGLCILVPQKLDVDLFDGSDR